MSTPSIRRVRRAKPVRKSVRQTGLGFIGKIDVAIAILDATTRFYNLARDFWRRKFQYTVVVSEKDALYTEVHAWLLKTMPEEKHRAISVSTTRVNTRNTYEVPEDSGGQDYVPPPLVIKYNENASRTVELDGHKITFYLRIPEGSDKISSLREPEYAKIEFTASSHAGQKAVVKHLEKLNSQRSKHRKPVLKMVGQWGSWTTRSDLPPRTMDSVILPVEQKERVEADLRKFLASEDQYNRLAIPWHRGYMFHGPPGTGKTSLVKALANEFNLDLWYVSLADLGKESSLLGLLAEVTPRSLLLLEDIDTMRITHDRDGAEQGKISMSSLLNTLDGVATPHGLITVMTTNRFDVLDPALTRAGRMDMIELLDYPSIKTISDMFKHFFGETPNWGKFEKNTTPIEGLSTSQLAETMKRHLENPKAASKEVLDILKATA